jgi:two-component system cell cycle response regulator DivK
MARIRTAPPWWHHHRYGVTTIVLESQLFDIARLWLGIILAIPTSMMWFLVLVAEPDPPSAKLCSLVLGKAGLMVRTAGSAGEVQRALSEQRPDAVLVDLDLPPDGGLELARRLSADPVHVPIIALSTQTGPDAEREALDAGCAGFISKPIDVGTFAARVRTLVRGAAGA